MSFVPVSRDGKNDVYLLDPSEGEGAKLVQMVKERSSAPPALRIDGHEVVLMDRVAVHQRQVARNRVQSVRSVA